MLFKVEGQNITNQRTEPHKSLISKNVSEMKTLCDCLDIFFSVFDLWHFSLCWFLLSACFQTLKTKQGMLKEDWEFFKQRRFIEEQVRHVIMTLSFYNGVLQLCPSKRCNGFCFCFFVVTQQ